MSVDLEFAIKQDIRNNPVVREVDAAQRREFFRLLGGAAAVLIMLLVVLWPRLSQQRQSYRLEDLREELAQENRLNRKYTLELETLLRPQLLEQRASDARHDRPLRKRHARPRACRPLAPSQSRHRRRPLRNLPC